MVNVHLGRVKWQKAWGQDETPELASLYLLLSTSHLRLTQGWCLCLVFSAHNSTWTRERRMMREHLHEIGKGEGKTPGGRIPRSPLVVCGANYFAEGPSGPSHGVKYSSDHHQNLCLSVLTAGLGREVLFALR